ncbi:hypothetical protein [Comamonas sp. E6]|uniref:hypothetical protein n=1 Tax=Comamonas sp. E6 TaxID=364029 RepID=UPI000750F937|nr:hypothetical protein [Comamonas sp. E6]
MAFGLAFFLVLIAFTLMSKVSRVVMLTVVGISAVYVIWLKKYGDINFSQLKSIFQLLSINIGVLILGAIWGIMESMSNSDEEYRCRRQKFLIFLSKWGAIYLVYNFLGTKIFNIYFKDETAGFFVMRFFGGYVFAAFFVLYYLYRWRQKRSTA